MQSWKFKNNPSNEFIAVASITSYSAKDGLLKLKIFFEEKQQILAQKFFFIDFYGNIRKIFVEKIVQRGDSNFVKFKGFSEERELKIFLDKEILIQKKNLVLDENTFLTSELIDCEVFFRKKKIGKVVNVIIVPSNNLIEIRIDDGKELMIPFVLKFFEKIDTFKKKIYLSEKSSFLLYDEN